MKMVKMTNVGAVLRVPTPNEVSAAETCCCTPAWLRHCPLAEDDDGEDGDADGDDDDDQANYEDGEDYSDDDAHYGVMIVTLEYIFPTELIN